MVRRARWKPAVAVLSAAVSLGVLTWPATAGAAPRYPDLRTLAPAQLHLSSTPIGDEHHYVVRFSNVVWNAGLGPFELHGTPHFPPDGLFDASQWIYDDAGVEMQPVGTFVFHSAHQHFHFEGFARYELWTKREFDRAAARGFTSGQPTYTSPKVSSCILDLRRVDSTMGPPQAVYRTCTPLMEGISSGWGDVYGYLLPDQWVDVGQMPLSDGEYVLRSVADPDNLVYESPGRADPARESEIANSASTPFTVRNGRLVAGA